MVRGGTYAFVTDSLGSVTAIADSSGSTDATRFVLARRRRWRDPLPAHRGATGALFKENASISGAEIGCQGIGCQGEVGSACSMASAELAEILGGSPEQVENAAEIGFERNLGRICDPVGGLVQIPRIERNAIALIKAITAAWAWTGPAARRYTCFDALGRPHPPMLQGSEWGS